MKPNVTAPTISEHLDPVAKEQLEKIAATLWRNGFNMVVTRRQSYIPACLSCGKPCTRRRNKYCTHECWARTRIGHEKTGGREPILDDKICECCKKKFHPKNHRRKFCGRQCYDDYRSDKNA